MKKMKNLELVEVFKAAKSLIEDKSERFICLAIGATGRMNLRWLARNIITGRLAGAYTCEAWLEEHGIKSDEFLTEDPQGKQWMREYRLRWLDSLIAEFS